MEYERRSSRRSGTFLRVLLLILLICTAVIVIFLRFRSLEAQIQELAEQLETEVAQNTQAEAQYPVLSPPVTDAESDTAIPASVPEEPMVNETEAVVEMPEITGPQPVVDPEHSDLSFYQRLAQGYNVNLLIMGDATAMGLGATAVEESEDGKDHRWFVQLSDYLSERYLNGQTPYISSLASEGASVLEDTLFLKSSSDETDYNLILFSYGLNENTKDGMAFEALLLALHEKYPNASFITTIEPCHHMITTPLEYMRGISYDYGIPFINLYGYFFDNSHSFNEYVSHFDIHQTFPGDKGQDEWFELLKKEIDANVEASTGKFAERKPIDALAPQFAKMKYISVDDSAVHRVDDTSYTVDTKVNGLAYMLHKENIGNNDVKVVADDMLYGFRKPNGIALSTGGYLSIIYAELISENSFTITFSSKEYADELMGFYFYYPEQ